MMLEGLKYTRTLGFSDELNIDSVTVVNVIRAGTTRSDIGFSLVKNIRRLLEMDWEVHIFHSYRKAN
jgi:hypothetical protein